MARFAGAIVASRVGIGIAEAAIMTCCTTLITDYYDGVQRNRYLGLQVMVSALAATAFFALDGLLGNVSWRARIWMYAVSLVIVVPMAFLLWEPAKTEPITQERTTVPWGHIGSPALMTLFGGVVFYALTVHLPSVRAGSALPMPA